MNLGMPLHIGTLPIVISDSIWTDRLVFQENVVRRNDHNIRSVACARRCEQRPFIHDGPAFLLVLSLPASAASALAMQLRRC